jgi:hypothetical protein
MQPHNGTRHIPRPQMQPIPLPQINRRHTNPLPSLLAAIILPRLLEPKLLNGGGTLLPEPGLDQEAQILICRHEIRASILGPKGVFDKCFQALERMPAPEFAGAIGFGVERCA